MDNLVKLAKSHSPNLMEQIYFMESIKTETWSWRRVRMNKELMTNLVNTLTKYKDGTGEHDRAIFETFLYGVFDEKNRRYTVIQHLALLAEVLVEKRRVDLVDDITFANHNAAYELDIHLRELKY